MKKLLTTAALSIGVLAMLAQTVTTPKQAQMDLSDAVHDSDLISSTERDAMAIMNIEVNANGDKLPLPNADDLFANVSVYNSLVSINGNDYVINFKEDGTLNRSLQLGVSKEFKIGDPVPSYEGPGSD